MEDLEVSVAIDAKKQKEIETEVERLKAGDVKLKRVFPIVVEGTEYDEKPMYVAYFKQPTFAIFSKFLSLSQKDNAVAMRSLANDCFLSGDRELITDDSLFLFGLSPYLSQIIESRHGQLVNLSKAGK
jgi:hypothetical protein